MLSLLLRHVAYRSIAVLLVILAIMANGFAPSLQRIRPSRSMSADCDPTLCSSWKLFSLCVPPESGTDFYEILGVEHFSDPQEIKSAYRQLVKQYHPDANPDSATDSDKFREISHAYQVLSDPVSRSRYDKYGERGLNIEDIPFRYPDDPHDSRVAGYVPRRRKRFMFDEQCPEVGYEEEFPIFSNDVFPQPGRDGLPLASPENSVDFLYIGQQDYFVRDPSISRLDSQSCQFQDMLRSRSRRHNDMFEDIGSGFPHPNFGYGFDYDDEDEDEEWHYSEFGHEPLGYNPHPPPPRQPRMDVRYRTCPPHSGEHEPAFAYHTAAASHVHFSPAPFFAPMGHTIHEDMYEPPPPFHTGYGPSLFSQTAYTPMIQRQSTDMPDFTNDQFPTHMP